MKRGDKKISKWVVVLSRLLYGSGRMDLSTLFVRIFMGAMMITGAITKSQDYPFLVGSFPDLFGMGSGNSVTAVGLAELVCGCMLVMGLLVRVAALVVALGMFAATFLLFPDKSFSAAELSFVYMCVSVALIISGGGRYSLDALGFRGFESI